MAEHKPSIDFEKRDIAPPVIVRAAVIVTIVTLVASVAVLGLLNLFGQRADEQDAPNPPLARHEQGRLAPGPRLQEQPFADVETLHAEERALLTSGAWVDEDAGIARIPVEEAMKIVAEKGLPSWPPPPPSPGPGASAPSGAVR